MDRIAKLGTVILLLMTVSFNLWADLPEKQIRRIIAECDVADTVLRAKDAPTFWKVLQQTNPGYRRAAKSLRGNGDRDIKREMMGVVSNCQEYFTNVKTLQGSYDLAEHLTDRLGIRATSPLASLTVTEDKDIALFGYPNGYMFMTAGLFNELRTDTAALASLFAAEAAHYALQHAYEHQKWEKKRRNKHNIWKIIGSIFITVASVVIDNATNGDFPAELGLMAAEIVALSPTNPRYNMHYTPMQVHESDIIAYRFMEVTTGTGESYIKALDKVGNDIDATSGLVGEDYPTVSERISVLEYLKAHPETRQRVKVSRLKPQPVPKYFDIFSPRNYR